MYKSASKGATPLLMLRDSLTKRVRQTNTLYRFKEVLDRCLRVFYSSLTPVNAGKQCLKQPTNSSGY
eukprot:snap_masked-scaffold_2-processed-gene-6.0-mRNA-1 protein AED:1.00 eAED:1.00 QI:0/0/0/0/1/1/2/0/66